MGNRVSRVMQCFMPPKHDHEAAGILFSEPLDEGLGHSFCYIRPALDSLTDSPTRHDSAELVKTDGLPVPTGDRDQDSSSAEISPETGEEAIKNRNLNEKSKNISETSFKSISGASVSANTSTPRSILSHEQFNSFSNIPYDRAAAFESTPSFSALPLQPIPRGISYSGPMSGPLSGPLSGNLERGFLSGPLERGFLSGPLERGFMSGPLERGFMSGPIERGFTSGPLERGYLSGPLEQVDRSQFSAPLGLPYSAYLKKRRKSLAKLVQTVSKPVKKAFTRTVSNLARTQKSLIGPVKNFMTGEGRHGRDGSREAQSHTDSQVETGYTSSEMDMTEKHNLQWAQGKAGEDRVHVVLSEEHGWLFVGIYDGFSGPDAPDFLMSNLYPAIYKELKGLLWDRKEAFEARLDQNNIGTSDEEFQFKTSEQQHNGSNSIDAHSIVESTCNGWIRMARTVSGDNVKTQNLCSKGDNEEEDKRWEQPDSGCCSNSSGHDYSQTHKGSPQQIVNNDFDFHVCANSTNGNVGVELDGKLAEDRTLPDSNREQPVESLKQAAVMPDDILLDSTQKQLKVRSLLGAKLKQAYGRRKRENHRKLFQWRYDWEQERIEAQKRMKEKLKVEEDERKHSRRGHVDHQAVLQALAKALANTEAAYLEMADKAVSENPELALIGSCVLVMLMKDEDVYVMNVGDSRAVLAQDRRIDPLEPLGKGTKSQTTGQGNKTEENERIGARDSMLRMELERIIEETPMELEALEANYAFGEVAPPPISPTLGALQLSSDHSTNIDEEVVRIKMEHPDDHGAIANDRVKGRLKVTRAFGAGFLKQPKWNDALLEMFRIDFIGTEPYITCSPFLNHHRLGPHDHFLVLSSDGLYQYLSNEEVVSHVEWFMEKSPDGDPAQYLIEELLFRAAKKNGMDFHELLDIPHGDRRRYHDDVSVMVISLEGRIWRSSS